MRKQQILFILLTAFWFIGTNHCAFGICASQTSSNNSASDTSIPFQSNQHEHSGEDSHPCGTPCNVGVTLSSSQDSVAKVVLLPDRIIGTVLSFLVSFTNTPDPFVVSISVEESHSPHVSTPISTLRDAPNAPPVLRT